MYLDSSDRFRSVVEIRHSTCPTYLSHNYNFPTLQRSNDSESWLSRLLKAVVLNGVNIDEVLNIKNLSPEIIHLKNLFRTGSIGESISNGLRAPVEPLVITWIVSTRTVKVFAPTLSLLSAFKKPYYGEQVGVI